MITEARIDTIVSKAIPLNATCRIEREKELKRRAKLKTSIQELLNETNIVREGEAKNTTSITFVRDHTTGKTTIL